MKKNIIFIALCLIVNIVIAQSVNELKFTKDKDVYLNNTKLSESTSIEEINEILGTPVIYKEFTTTGKINYHYKELGISVHMVNGKLLFIGVNINWDGDKNFPETPYNGSVIIDGVSFNKKSTDETISEIKVVEIFSPFPGLYMTKERNTKRPIVIGVKDNMVTQVGFEFH